MCRLPESHRARYLPLVGIPFAPARTASRRLPGAHPDRDWRRRAHEPLVGRLEQAFGLGQVDRPTDAEYAIAEQALGFRVPVSRPYALPSGWSKVIRHNAPHLAMPRALIFRLRQLGRDRGHEEADDGNPEQAAEAAQSTD